jgi:hypothetical protein
MARKGSTFGALPAVAPTPAQIYVGLIRSNPFCSAAASYRTHSGNG